MEEGGETVSPPFSFHKICFFISHNPTTHSSNTTFNGQKSSREIPAVSQ